MSPKQQKVFLGFSIVVFICAIISSLYFLHTSSNTNTQSNSNNPNIVEVPNSEKKFAKTVLEHLFNHTSFNSATLRKVIKEDKVTKKELSNLLKNNVYSRTQGYYNLKANYVMPNSPIDFNEDYLKKVHADLALPLWVGTTLEDSQIDEMENLTSINVGGKQYPAVRVKTIVGLKNYYLQLGSQEGWDGKVYGGSETYNAKVDLIILKNTKSESGFSLYDVEIGDTYANALVYNTPSVSPIAKTRTFEFYVDPSLDSK